MSVTYNFVEPLKDPEWISGKDILPLLENVKNPVGIEIGVDEGTAAIINFGARDGECSRVDRERGRCTSEQNIVGRCEA